MNKHTYLDKSSWDHTPLTPRAPNVFFVTLAVNAGEEKPDNLHTDLYGVVVLGAAKKQPSWTFLVRKAGVAPESTTCVIFAGDEQIGSLSMDINYKGNQYGKYVLALTTPSLKRNTRFGNITSADPKRILRAVMTECKPTTLMDKLYKAASEASTKANQTLYHATNYSVDTTVNPCVLYRFLEAKGLWADYTEYAIASGAASNFGQSISEKAALKVKADTLYRSQTFVDCSMFIHMGGEYYGMPDVHMVPVAVTPPQKTELDDDARTKVGMLKLAPVGSIVADVGLRVDLDSSTPVYIVKRTC